MNIYAWRASLAIIGTAAAGMVAWSLYVVAHDAYHVPTFLAAAVGIVFDGAALACLYLASQAANAGRGAAAPRLATFALAGVSVYLNLVHAHLVHGGIPAGTLYASPTLALLLVCDLAWAATRAANRDARGDHPFRIPVIGVWGWILAREQAWGAVRSQAAAHVAALAAHPAGTTPETITVARDDQTPALPAPATAPQISALPIGSPAATKTDAVLAAASILGDTATAAVIADLVQEQHGLVVTPGHVRAVLSEQRRKTEQAAPQAGTQGYL